MADLEPGGSIMNTEPDRDAKLRKIEAELRLLRSELRYAQRWFVQARQTLAALIDEIAEQSNHE